MVSFPNQKILLGWIKKKNETGIIHVLPSRNSPHHKRQTLATSDDMWKRYFKQMDLGKKQALLFYYLTKQPPKQNL